MKISAVYVLASALGLSSCHELPVVPAIPAGVPPKTLTLDLKVKNAGVEGIGEQARLRGTVEYSLTCMTDADLFEEKVGAYRLALDTEVMVEAECGPEIQTGSWRVHCESCDNFQIRKGELRKVRKAYPLDGLGPGVSLFIEYDARETGLAASRAWIASKD